MLSLRNRLDGQRTRLADKSDKSDGASAVSGDDHEVCFFCIDLSIISIDPTQPRKLFDSDSLADLSESIKQTGVLQPILIRKDFEGRIWLVAGERRYRAAVMAGLERIPAIVTTGNPHEIALIENLQREDLNPIEEAEALERLASDHHHTHEDLARIISKGRSTVTEILSLNRLPETIKSECRSSRKYSRRLLVEIAKADNEGEMLLLFEKAKKDALRSPHVRTIRRKKPNSHAATRFIIRKVLSLSESLDTLDVSMTDEEKKQLCDALAQLERKIIRLQDNVGAPTGELPRQAGQEAIPERTLSGLSDE